MTEHVCRNCQGAGQIKFSDWPPGSISLHTHTTCYECKGAGIVEREGCYHDWKWVRELGRCYNLYECEICGREDRVDSGD